MAMAKTAKLLAGSALCTMLLGGAAGAKETYTNMARMQAMDKITGRVSEIDVPVNGEVVFGSFSIVVRACATRPPEETPENYAFVDVVDNYNSQTPVNIFKGWMVSSSPALNAIEHPIYDVWLLKCYDGDLKGKKILDASVLKARDEIIKAKPKSAIKEEAAKEETLLQIPEKQPQSEEMKAAAAPQDSAEKNEVIPASPLESEPVLNEEGAPKPLIIINDNVVVDEEKEAEKQPVSSNAAETSPVNEILDELKTDVAENPPAEVVTEPAAPTPQPELPLPLPEPSSDAQTESVDNNEISEPAADTSEEEEQLIRFDDEVEEDGFELNAEALAN